MSTKKKNPFAIKMQAASAKARWDNKSEAERSAIMARVRAARTEKQLQAKLAKG